MKLGMLFVVGALAVAPTAICGRTTTAMPGEAAAEYSKHFKALRDLSVAVAEAMPAEQYGFRPHPESMNFGEVMAHIATTNYQFCAGLKDSQPPAMPTPTEKAGIAKFLSDSFAYCGGVLPGLTAEELDKAHDSPDGHLPGREILLAMFVHVAHQRGQAEIYLRDKGIRPPGYRV